MKRGIKRILVVLLCSLLNIAQAAAVIVLITAVPTGAGVVSSKFRDGNDGGAAPPSAPEISQPAVIDDDSASIPLLTACAGGTAPLVYEIEKSSTSAVASFAVHATGITFTGGLYTITTLTASTQYWVRLACVDNASRRSAYSSVFTFTTPADVGGDVTAPTTPTISALTSTVAGVVNVTWVNGTDAVGVTGTHITRALGTGPGGSCDVQATGVRIATVGAAVTTYQDSGLTGGQEYAYLVRNFDAAGNMTVNSTRECVVAASVSAIAVKWYDLGYGIKARDDTGSDLGSRRTTFSNVTASAGLNFIHLRYLWGRLNPTGSTDDWLDLDADIAAAQAVGASIEVQINWKCFSGCLSSVAIGPSDLSSDRLPSSSGFTMAMHRAAVMDRFIAFSQRLATRYDNNVTVIGVMPNESAPSLAASPPTDYSTAAWASQLKRLYTASRTAFVKTPYFANLNSLGGQIGGTNGLLEYAYQEGLGFAAPDCRSTTNETGITLFSGTTKTGEPAPVRDYRGLMPATCVVSDSALNYDTAANIIDYFQARTFNRMNFIIFTATTSGRTFAQSVTAMEADPVLATACPSGVGGVYEGIGCDTTP